MGIKNNRNRIFAKKCHEVFLIANKGRLSGVTGGLFCHLQDLEDKRRTKTQK